MVKKILFFFILFISFKGFSQQKWYVNDVYDASTDVYTLADGDDINNDGLSTYTPKASLQTVVGLASSGDIIYIDAGYYSNPGTAPIDMVVNKSLHIIGAGSLSTIFDNNGRSTNSNAFATISADNVTLEGFKIIRYNEVFGDDGILNIDGALGVVIRDVLTDENKQAAGGEGTIMINSPSQVDFYGGGSNCNSAESGAGGGVFVNGDNNIVKFYNYSFSNNHTAQVGGSALRIVGTNNTTSVEVYNSVIDDNDNSNLEGGAGIFIKNATLHIEGSCFYNNTQHDAGGSKQYGTGIAVRDNSNVTINGCSFTENGYDYRNDPMWGDNVYYNLDGGAIGIYGNNIDVNINDSYFQGNVAGGDDGADVSLRTTGANVTVDIDNSYFTSSKDQFYNYSGGLINITNSGDFTTFETYGNVIDDGVSPIGSFVVPTCPIKIGSCYGDDLTTVVPSTVVVLPADDLILTGYNDGNSNQLNWSSSSEQNTQYHILMRAGTDGVFEEISIQNAIGNSKSMTYYSDEDNNALPFGYYKIKVIDFDGETTTYSNIILLEKGVSKEEIELTISPNPTNNSANIYFTSKISDDMVLNIYNSIGQLLVSKNVSASASNSKLNVDLSSYASGVYSIEVKNSTTNNVQRLIKL